MAERVKWFAIGSIVLSLLFVFLGVPVLLSYSPEPIIHMSNLYVTGDASCNVHQHVTLANDGGGAGEVWLTLYVNHQAFTNWSAFMPPRTTVPEVFSTYVPACTSSVYALGLTDLVPA